MEYRWLGRTGVRVSAISLGTVYFGSRIPTEAAERIIGAALDGGVNFIDTAESYMRPHEGAAEEAVGRALVGRRQAVVLATKKRYDPAQFRSGGPSDHGLSRHQIVAAVEGSLRRLRTDYIDLYYPHHPDPHTALEESLRAFDDLVRAGKVRLIGLSNYPAWQVVRALWTAERQALAPVAGVQTLYNLLDRQVERELVPACAEYGLGLVAYSPLAGGVLTGKYRPGAPPPPGSRAVTVGQAAAGRPAHIPLLNEVTLAAAGRVAAAARELGLSAGQASLAWLLGQTAVSSVILGASDVEQVREGLAASGVSLDEGSRARLTAAADGS